MMFLFLIIGFGILTRLIPHLPNFSPEIVFAVYLGMRSPKVLMYFNILLMAVVSDALIGWQRPHFPSFGSWTFFTYSALLIIGWSGARIRTKSLKRTFVITTCLATLGYWLWTNLGVWLVADFYPHTPAGFVACYTLALPFLANSLTASMSWYVIIMLCEYYFPKSCPQPSQIH